MDWWIVAIVVSQLAFIAFLIATGVNYRQKTLQRRSEERLRVLDRFSSGQELSDFLATEHGRSFIDLFATKATDPTRIAIGWIALGVLLAFLGSAFLLLSWLDAQDLGVEYMVAAVIVLAAALGLASASLVSLRLARRFKLLPADAPAEQGIPQ